MSEPDLLTPTKKLIDFCTTRGHKIKNKNLKELMHYKSGPNRYVGPKLVNDQALPACYEHANRFCDGKLTNKTVILVHPFYIGIQPVNNSKKISSYLKTVFGVIDKVRKNDEWSINYCTFPLTYNYEAVEKRIFNKVLFTEFFQGTSLDNLDEFNDKKALFLGCYGNLCFHTMINEFLNQTNSEISIMPEGVLFADQNNDNYPLVGKLISEHQSIREIKILNFEDFLSL